MKRPLIVALNPSVDVEWRVTRVRWGEKNEIQSERRWPGGKGVNVARWLKHLGMQPRLLLPLGGRHGQELEAGLSSERITTIVCPIRGQTRANIIVTGPPEGQLRFNPPGPELSGAEWAAVRAMVNRELRNASVLVLSGSLPRGPGAGAYAELIRLAQRQDVRCLLDCDGLALEKAVAAHPWLVKPNHHELGEWYGRPLRNARDIRIAAEKLSAATKGWVFVSTGPDGGCLVRASSHAFLTARPPRVTVQNTVGAGDALLAAIAKRIGDGAGPEEWIRAGVGVGTAASTSPAGVLPPRSVIRRMTEAVRIIDTKPDSRQRVSK
jgi:1-phosphofructokinase family hexose kinase